MPVSLTKGQNVSLTKEAPGLNNVLVGLGWDARSTTGDEFDLDASALLVGDNGKVAAAEAFVFYGNKQDAAGSVIHQGDNLTGQGDGDDEVINIDLSRVPADVKRVVIAVSIYEADSRNQNFGQVRNAFCRIVNKDNGSEVARYDLSEDSSVESAMVFAELYRNSFELPFRVVDRKSVV